MQNEIDALRNLQTDVAAEDVNATSLTDVDVEVFAMQPPVTNSDILVEFFETGNISDRDDKVMGYQRWLGRRANRITRKIWPRT